MYIRVRYTDEKEYIVNPNCPVRILLDYIRSVVQADEEYDASLECELDLCDENSVLKNLGEAAPWTNFYEAGILIPRNIYYVVLLERDEDGTMKPILMLARNTRLYTEMITKLRRQLQPQLKQKSRGEKGRPPGTRRSLTGGLSRN